MQGYHFLDTTCKWVQENSKKPHLQTYIWKRILKATEFHHYVNLLQVLWPWDPCSPTEVVLPAPQGHMCLRYLEEPHSYTRRQQAAPYPRGEWALKNQCLVQGLQKGLAFVVQMHTVMCNITVPTAASNFPPEKHILMGWTGAMKSPN